MFTMGQLIVVFWRHANTYCDVILTDCTQFLSWSRMFPLRRQIDYRVLNIESDSRRSDWLACKKQIPSFSTIEDNLKQCAIIFVYSLSNVKRVYKFNPVVSTIGLLVIKNEMCFMLVHLIPCFETRDAMGHASRDMMPHESKGKSQENNFW